MIHTSEAWNAALKAPLLADLVTYHDDAGATPANVRRLGDLVRARIACHAGIRPIFEATRQLVVAILEAD